MDSTILAQIASYTHITVINHDYNVQRYALIHMNIIIQDIKTSENDTDVIFNKREIVITIEVKSVEHRRL